MTRSPAGTPTRSRPRASFPWAIRRWISEISATGGGARVLDRDRSAPQGRAGQLRGPGGRPPRARGRGGADPAGDRRDARAPGATADGRASGRRGGLRRRRLRRLAPAADASGEDRPRSRARRRRRWSTKAAAGRGGSRPADRARRGQSDPRVRGGPAGGERRRDAHGGVSFPDDYGNGISRGRARRSP